MPKQKKDTSYPPKTGVVQCNVQFSKAKHGVWKFFGKLHLDFFSLEKDGNINVIETSYCCNTSLSFFSSFKTVYTAVNSVQEPLIMEKYPIFHICRTAGFKIDWYIPKPETFCQLSGEMPLCIITITTFEALLSVLLYVRTPVSDRHQWSSNLDTEVALDSWLLCTRKVKLLKIMKTHSVVNITKAYTQIFSKAVTKKRNYLPTKAMCSSVRCVILTDKPRALIILRETWFEFVFLG